MHTFLFGNMLCTLFNSYVNLTIKVTVLLENFSNSHFSLNPVFPVISRIVILDDIDTLFCYFYISQTL